MFVALSNLERSSTKILLTAAHAGRRSADSAPDLRLPSSACRFLRHYGCAGGEQDLDGSACVGPGRAVTGGRN
jgi:hypothetical protein